MDYRSLIRSFQDYDECSEAVHLVYEEARKDLPKVIYKYISFGEDKDLNDKKLCCLREGKIYLSSPDEFNDPFDDRAFFIDIAEVKNHALTRGMEWRLEDLYKPFKRFACLTASGVSNMPMWAHYAGNHKGFCVSYELSFDNFELTAMILPVQYTDKRIDITSLLKHKIDVAFKQGSLKPIEDVLLWSSIVFGCVKEETWKYEKEYRCVRPDSNYLTPFIAAKPTNIYIGVNCDIENKTRLIDIAHKNMVPIHQMKMAFDTKDYRLQSEKLI